MYPLTLKVLTKTNKQLFNKYQ